jgi:anti-anti-sigma factor
MVTTVSTEQERIQIVHGDDGSISVHGELDAYTAPQLDAAINESDSSRSPLVLDLSGVTFIDSSALQVLVAHFQRLSESDCRLQLRSPSAAVTRLLDVTGLTEHFGVGL